METLKQLQANSQQNLHFHNSLQQWKSPLRQPRLVSLPLCLHALRWRLPLRHPRLVSLPLRLCALQWILLLRQPRPVSLPLRLRALQWILPLRQPQASFIPVESPQTAQVSLTPLASMRTRMEIAPQTAQARFTPLESPQTAQVSLTPLASMRTRMEIATQTAQASFTPLESPQTAQVSLTPLASMRTRMEITPQTAQASLTPLASRMEITPQTAQASLTPLASRMEITPQTAQASLTPLASLRTRMEIAPKLAKASPFIPSHNNVLLPANLFQSIQCSEGTSDTLDIQCSIDEISHEQIDDDDEVLLTKAAKLLYKIIGKHSELTRFDYLRSKFRKLQCKKQRPTTTERNEYETLTAKLQICILSCKYTTKDAIKAMEKDYIGRKGLQLDILDQDYNKLLKKLSLVKKILSIWSQFKL